MRAPKQISIGDQEIDLEKIVAETLEKLLAPVAETICEMERIRRKEYLTEKEALLFSLSAATLKTQRSRGGGSKYVKVGSRILYPKNSLTHFYLKTINHIEYMYIHLQGRRKLFSYLVDHF